MPNHYLENDAVISSIFVNPLQFGPREDLARYPSNLAGDRKLLERAKTDILFLPPLSNRRSEIKD